MNMFQDSVNRRYAAEAINAIEFAQIIRADLREFMLSRGWSGIYDEDVHCGGTLLAAFHFGQMQDFLAKGRGSGSGWLGECAIEPQMPTFGDPWALERSVEKSSLPPGTVLILSTLPSEGKLNQRRRIEILVRSPEYDAEEAERQMRGVSTPGFPPMQAWADVQGPVKYSWVDRLVDLLLAMFPKKHGTER